MHITICIHGCVPKGEQNPINTATLKDIYSIPLQLYLRKTLSGRFCTKTDLLETVKRFFMKPHSTLRAEDEEGLAELGKCPMRQQPLLLIPLKYRSRSLEQEVSVGMNYV